jgi:hypothetical protein
VSKHVGQSREGERDVPECAVAILGDSLDRREPTVVVRAPTCVTACDQTCLREPTFDAVNPKHQARHKRLQGELAWRADVQDHRRHLQIASAATSRDIFMRMMALPLGTFLGDTQPATHHGESKGFLKVVWCCGMYMQIFQCVSGSPYLHWQAMPAVARSSIETRLCRTLLFVELPCGSRSSFGRINRASKTLWPDSRREGRTREQHGQPRQRAARARRVRASWRHRALSTLPRGCVSNARTRPTLKPAARR